MNGFKMKLYDWVNGVLKFEEHHLHFHDLEEAIEFAGNAICNSVKIYSSEGLVVHELTKSEAENQALLANANASGEPVYMSTDEEEKPVIEEEVPVVVEELDEAAKEAALISASLAEFYMSAPIVDADPVVAPVVAPVVDADPVVAPVAKVSSITKTRNKK